MDKEVAAEKINEILNEIGSGNLKEYQDACKKTAKRDFASSNEERMTWGLGITGEAGDVASCIKKTYFHDNDQREGIKENLGDTLWYVAMICNFFDWNLQGILDENLKKLKERYSKGFFRTEDAQRDGKMIDWSKKDGSVD